MRVPVGLFLCDLYSNYTGDAIKNGNEAVMLKKLHKFFHLGVTLTRTEAEIYYMYCKLFLSAYVLDLVYEDV